MSTTDRTGRMLKFVLLVTLILAACSTTIAGSATTDPVIPRLTTETPWWIDTTGTISYETMQIVQREADEIEREGFQLGGVFFLNSVSESLDVCKKFGTENGIGNSETNNGLAICIFTEKAGADGTAPAAAIAVGSGLGKTFSDAKALEFLRKYFLPEKNEGRWEKGVIALTKAVHRYLQNPENEEFKDPPMDPAMVVLLIAFFVIVIILIVIDGAYNGFEITTGVIEAMSKGDGGSMSGGASV